MAAVIQFDSSLEEKRPPWIWMVQDGVCLSRMTSFVSKTLFCLPDWTTGDATRQCEVCLKNRREKKRTKMTVLPLTASVRHCIHLFLVAVGLMPKIIIFVGSEGVGFGPGGRANAITRFVSGILSTGDRLLH